MIRLYLILCTFLVIFFTTGGLLAQTAPLNPMEKLGKKIFFDNIAAPDKQSCASCHGPETGFTGPHSGINQNTAVYPGAVEERFGNRRPPSAAYAAFSPLFNYVGTLFVGGNFVDGRATGWQLGNPAADQALGPFLNPVEQNNPDKSAVLRQISCSPYAWMWKKVFGKPINVNSEADYGKVGLAIAAYEASSEVSAFTSKYDYYLKGRVKLSPQETRGLALFKGRGKCADCHIADPGPGGTPPLFTDFTYDNLGLPKNPLNPFYRMDRVRLKNGELINPLGDQWIDYGLGDFLRKLADPQNQSWRTLPYVPARMKRFTNSELAVLAKQSDGKHRTSTLRNVDKRPGKGFVKVFMHNGVLKSLKEVVHFYNTRDVKSWPPPEVTANINKTELGNLGLTDAEENDIVAFMKTLSDGYVPAEDSGVISKKWDALSFVIAGPNPCNPQTSFKLELPEAAEVDVQVFNLLGQPVKLLGSGYFEAGLHVIHFNGEDLPTGVYLVRLQAGKEIKTLKVGLIR